MLYICQRLLAGILKIDSYSHMTSKWKVLQKRLHGQSESGREIGERERERETDFFSYPVESATFVLKAGC